MLITDVVVVGAGPIGLFAVFQSGMLGMKTHVIDSLSQVGGQCITLYPEKPIYDIPGYPKILAAELIEMLAKQANNFEPVYHLNQQAINIIKSEEDNTFVVTTSKDIQIKTKAIIIAAGPGSFGPNKPPLKNIDKFENKSLFYFVNNKSNFINKKIVIAGGGDSALDWTIYLSDIAEKIYLVHRRNKFRGAPETIKQVYKLSELGKVEVIVNFQLDELLGNNGLLETVNLVDLNNNKISLKSDILIPCFGLSQDLGPILNWGLDIKLNQIIVNQPFYETNISGIYAVGDVANYTGKLKLILSGFAEVASSVHHLYSRVFDGKALHFEYSTSKLGNK